MAPRSAAVDDAFVAEHRREGNATLAIFDLDRTLVSGSSLFPLASELARAGVLARRTVARAAIRNARYRRRGASDRRVDSVRRGVAELAIGRDYDPIAEVAMDVGGQLVADMSPTARMLVDRHLLAGDFCVVLSASPQELVDAVVHALGAHRGVGTRAQIVDGLLTGQLDGPFCYGAGKLERLRTELGEVPLDTAWAYADSMSDLPVLTAVGWPIVVNPDRRLQRIARSRHWPVLNF
jgi:HAD superfamily hydrolase (TIGR01490 family)